ncbi:hypothetical protein CYY_008942 [Polysphondylium violaceum]|uniref:Cytochrome c oxidase assembly protein n=1 Tax=Polysphondylium violaceum TaxID=133409 RepID=A0A8J4PMR0_9MYCE|nr:hypothetical protein CYY_008942 [Polysphondylium violaceum]
MFSRTVSLLSKSIPKSTTPSSFIYKRPSSFIFTAGLNNNNNNVSNNLISLNQKPILSTFNTTSSNSNISIKDTLFLKDILMNNQRLYSSSSNNNSNENKNNNNEKEKQENDNNNKKTFETAEERIKREREEYNQKLHEKNKEIAMYVLAAIITVLGLSYAAVPLYRVFCRVTGFGGTVREQDEFEPMVKRNLDRKVYPIKVTFTASTANKIPWTFVPVQKSIEVLPGEPVLAFYRATNNTDKAIIGVATYNITPQKAGSFFTKIQCFCFDEQRINPHETIDMPVLFVVEPEILDDKNSRGITTITLSYTFFKSNDKGELEEI